MCRLGTAGRAVVPVKLPLGGPELLRDCCPWSDCNLHLTYLGHRYPVSAAPTAPLFDPPLALQRHALVAGTHPCLLLSVSRPLTFSGLLLNPTCTEKGYPVHSSLLLQALLVLSHLFALLVMHF